MSSRIDRTALLLSARIRGCICDPDIRHHRRTAVTMSHDADCPAVDSGSQIVIARGRHQTPREFARAVADIVTELEDA